MKRLFCTLSLVAVFALPLLAQDKEQDRVENSGKVMQEILAAPDSIPQSVLDRADCVVVLPSVVKFAIGIGGSYGRGVMTCRGGADFRGLWGANHDGARGWQLWLAVGRAGYRFRPAADDPSVGREHPDEQGQTGG